MKIYIAGPYSSDPVAGTRNAISAGDTVLNCGDTPYIPHLTMFWHLMFPHPHNDWLGYDMEWLRVCDALIRLPGASDGAAEEEAAARARGMRVYQGLEKYTDDRQRKHRDTIAGSSGRPNGQDYAGQ